MTWHLLGDKPLSAPMMAQFTNASLRSNEWRKHRFVFIFHIIHPVPWFNIKMSSYQYGDCSYKYKIASWLSFLYSGNLYTRKDSLYTEMGPAVSTHYWSVHWPVQWYEWPASSSSPHIALRQCPTDTSPWKAPEHSMTGHLFSCHVCFTE